MNTLEALLDERAEALIRQEWAELEAHGLPNQGRHHGVGNRPHVTMAVAPTIKSELEAPLRAAIGDLPLSIEIGELTRFGHGPYVLVRLVVLTSDLLALQSAVAAVLGVDNLAPLLRPEVWTPHITLARRLGADQAEEATNWLGSRDLAVGPATLTGVRRWDGDAKREWPLMGQPGQDGRHD